MVNVCPENSLYSALTQRMRYEVDQVAWFLHVPSEQNNPVQVLHPAVRCGLQALSKVCMY